MPVRGWQQLLAEEDWYRGAGRYPLPAYSEFMPPPRVCKPYEKTQAFFADADLWGWPVSEYEEAWELRPGLDKIAQVLLARLIHLAHGRPAQGVPRHKLIDNPYWPPELAGGAGRLSHERFVVFAPLALSQTQDDKGRVRWTLFGGSEQGPGPAFWKSFYNAPGREIPEERAVDFFRTLLGTVFHVPESRLADLHAAGFRILPEEHEAFARPLWTKRFLCSPTSARGVKYLVTFRPFSRLPSAVRQAYLAGELHLMPFPGSLVFWGVPGYHRLQRDLPLAVQIPLLQALERSENLHGLRIPQSGWLHEPRPGHPVPQTRRVRNVYRPTHRWARVHRHQDELEVGKGEDHLAHVLFSTAPDDVGLYGKPMARNAQIWTHDYRLVLDGPRADWEEIHLASRALAGGGLFGYRLVFPAMRVGRHAVYWHRPLVAYATSQGEARVLPEAPLGYLTAYGVDSPTLENPVQLWPRLWHRDLHQSAIELFAHEGWPHWTSRNVRKLLEAHALLGERPLPWTFARQLLKAPKEETLEEWLNSLPARGTDPERGADLAKELRRRLDPGKSRPPRPHLPRPLTLHRTARRAFEIAYWNTIACLAHGEFRHKDNADIVQDPPTLAALARQQRDLEALGDYLLGYYQQAIARAGLTGPAWAAEHAFVWHTDFPYPWWGGWARNQTRQTSERNLLVRIPGRDSRQAVIMADHYDTAYMEDRYDKERGGNGARIAAAGADDNHSATAALMLAAPVFLELSRAGRLACDIWLVHLTGEEFPADCLGARRLCQALVEGGLRLRATDGSRKDLSQVRVRGVYVSDMIAHNNERDKDVFQIAAGAGAEAAALALVAHQANELWNARARLANRRPPRRHCGRGRRVLRGRRVPRLARFLPLHGEIRPAATPRSTLFNTDGQIFADAGIPVVLFMENYDINRLGYHDSHDTLANIDLDYGAALAAIVIETVAQAATRKK